MDFGVGQKIMIDWSDGVIREHTIVLVKDDEIVAEHINGHNRHRFNVFTILDKVSDWQWNVHCGWMVCVMTVFPNDWHTTKEKIVGLMEIDPKRGFYAEEIADTLKLNFSQVFDLIEVDSDFFFDKKTFVGWRLSKYILQA